MNEPMRKYMRVGIVNFMAFPATMRGEGPIIEATRAICRDDYFDVIEVTWIKDAETRKQVRKMVETAGLTLTYGGQPRMLTTGSNINDLDDAKRKAALDSLKAGIDEGYELGAKGFAFLSGKYQEESKKKSFEVLLDSTTQLCEYAAAKGDMPVLLEVFDYDFDKKSLIGPAPLARKFADKIKCKCHNFGLMVDLSHIVQIHESIRENILPIAPYVRHAHIANAVMKPGAEAVGDMHPRFGFPNSEIGVPEVVEFLRTLFDIGYLNAKCPPIVSFEVKPWGDGEDPEFVIANAKRTLNEAWARL
ncbi:MAG: sugar phosphate isomerase/epimerase [Planctomycetota bacterium]|jgi:sugar phosphate isomerase/epimerase|nr:sugar phosphate isomerase/epimerase [Planctomycetota bacterium]